MDRWQGIKTCVFGDYFYEVEVNTEVPKYFFPHNNNYRRIRYDEDKVIDFAISYMGKTNRELNILYIRRSSKYAIRIRREERILRFMEEHLNKLKERKEWKYMNKTEEIFEYNGYSFTYMDDVIGYMINRIAYKVLPGMNEDALYGDEYYKNVKHSSMEWKQDGQHGKVAFVIEPILSTIKVLIHTTLDKERMNELIKELQNAVDHIDGKGYYGN